MDDTELLFTEVLKCRRIDLYLDRKRKLDLTSAKIISQALKRRMKSEPMAYIIGKEEFMGMNFKVNPHVLIPRDDTEILVEAAFDYAKKIKSNSVNILDIGTGSGCIAVSLAKLMPEAKIFAIDISEEAVDTAIENARLNNVSGNTDFCCGDFFVWKPGKMKYDVIVCNPPYIPTGLIDTLAEDIQYEPRLALDGGEDGLDFYRRLKSKAWGLLKNNGFLILELGFGQLDAVKGLFTGVKEFSLAEVFKDYSQISRVIALQKKRLVYG